MPKGHSLPKVADGIPSIPNQSSSETSKFPQASPLTTAWSSSAAESLVHPFVKSLGLGLYSVNEEGIAKAIHRRGNDVHLTTAVFKLLDERYSSDADDVALFYLELVKSRSRPGTPLEMLKREPALRNLLIQILTTGIVTSKDLQASRYLVGLANQGSAPKLAPKILPAQTNTRRTIAKLTPSDFETAAKSLGDGISPAIVQAFAETESPKSGFGPDGLPIIAYEGHVFRKLTMRNNKIHPYDKSHPLLSYKFAKPAGPEWQTNNKNQESAWMTLKSAIALDRDAALQSCSWGMFQIMGYNFETCGYKTVDDFVAAMKSGEPDQLKAFVKFCKKNPRLIRAIREKDFAEMAKQYNGPKYSGYDEKIKKAYKKYLAL